MTQSKILGFTMIELVIVMVILGILTLMAVRPNLQNTANKIAVDSARKQVKSAIKFARLQAMQTGRKTPHRF